MTIIRWRSSIENELPKCKTEVLQPKFMPQLFVHWGANIPLSIDRLNDDDKNNAMGVLEKFGRQVPDLKRYPFLSKSYLDPQQNLKQKHSLENQKDGNQAGEGYDVYKSSAISFLKYRIQIKEKELEEHIKMFEKCKSEQKPNRITKRIIKNCEKNIPLRKSEIVKLKSELEPLKKQEKQKNRLLDLQKQATHYGIPTRIIKDAIASKKFYKDNVDLIVEEITKQIDLEKVNSQLPNKEVSQPDLILENENLRLKKEILKMELKLKNFNKEH